MTINFSKQLYNKEVLTKGIVKNQYLIIAALIGVASDVLYYGFLKTALRL